MAIYEGFSTNFDTMHEMYLQGAELEERFGFPYLEPTTAYPERAIRIQDSARNMKTKGCIVHFYTDDKKIESVWSDARRFVDNLRCYPAVIMPDLSVTAYQPPAMKVWNRYRNMVLARYFYDMGINIIPSLAVLGPEDNDWLMTGMPTGSTLAVSTVGRVKHPDERRMFLEGLYYCLEKLQPKNLIMYGIKPEEYQEYVPTIYLSNEKEFLNGKRIAETLEGLKAGAAEER